MTISFIIHGVPERSDHEWLENIAGTLSWKDVEERYKWIFADWKKNHNGNVANWEALICDFWSLLPAVDLIIRNCPRSRK